MEQEWKHSPQRRRGQPGLGRCVVLKKVGAQAQGRVHRKTTHSCFRYGVREKRVSEGGDAVFSLGPGETAGGGGQTVGGAEGQHGKRASGKSWGTLDNTRSGPERSQGGEENISERAGAARCQ